MKRAARRMPKRSWSSGRGALTLIALLLVGSGLVRMGTGSGSAIALEIKDRAAGLVSARRTVSEDQAPGPDEITPELLALLKQTREREKQVTKREAALQERLQALRLVETAVAQDLARLEAAEANLRATMASADKAAEGDLARLTSVYENMKPDQAAPLFQLMEPSFAAGFLGRMRPDAAAAILAGLDPDLAYSISVVLAGRNAGVPREPVPQALEQAPAE